MDVENKYLVRKEKKTKREKKDEIIKKIQKLIKGILWGLIPVAAIGGLVWYLVKTTPKNADLGKDLNNCVQHTGRGIHIHPHLSITINGQLQKIPVDIGVSPICMRPIHTHDDSGALHLEFARPRDVRLGEFFQVWVKEFSNSRIFDYYNTDDKKVKLFVNGVENFDFENYIMKDKDLIEIKYE